MFADLIRELDHATKTELFRRKISPSLLGDWRNGRRLPTEVQVVDLAAVTGADWVELQKEITVLRAPQERRQEIAAALNWRSENVLHVPMTAGALKS